MRLISWNCRGILNNPTGRELRALVCKFKPEIIFLMETRSDSNRMAPLSRILGYPNFYAIPSKGLTGGLCLFWNAYCIVNIVLYNDYIIYAHINSPFSSMSWSFFFVFMALLIKDKDSQFGITWWSSSRFTTLPDLLLEI